MGKKISYLNQATNEVHQSRTMRFVPHHSAAKLFIIGCFCSIMVTACNTNRVQSPISNNGANQTMLAYEIERKEYANNMLTQRPDLFLEKYHQLILNGQIVIGMSPFEAKLAGGAFIFKVIADSTIWPDHADPLKVMWAQSIKPDNSKIWMTFKNHSQYPNENPRTFRVHFSKGKAIEIEKLED